jgi:hypothetical protein
MANATGQVGRPSKYDPSFCAKVEELGALGYSVVEMAADIGVARNTLETEWPAQFPEFSEAFTHARQLSQAWWERIGRDNLLVPVGGGTFQASVWSRSMAARFPKDWREAKALTHEGPDGGPVKVENITRTIVDPKCA